MGQQSVLILSHFSTASGSVKCLFFFSEQTTLIWGHVFFQQPLSWAIKYFHPVPRSKRQGWLISGSRQQIKGSAICGICWTSRDTAGQYPGVSVVIISAYSERVVKTKALTNTRESRAGITFP